MPPIRSTPVAALAETAASWQRNHPGDRPEDIPWEVRLQSSQARAAFFTAGLGGRPLLEGFGACACCGRLTASWCEGCYHRCGNTPLTFSSVCQQCDSLKKVCELCGDLGITYAQGHQAYGIQRQQGTTDTVEIHVTEEWWRPWTRAPPYAVAGGPSYWSHPRDLRPGCRNMHWLSRPLEVSRRIVLLRWSRL